MTSTDFSHMTEKEREAWEERCRKTAEETKRLNAAFDPIFKLMERIDAE